MENMDTVLMLGLFIFVQFPIYDEKVQEKYYCKYKKLMLIHYICLELNHTL